jgi:hypothetical protein
MEEIKIAVSQEEYESYKNNKDTVKNERISSAHFLDSIMTPEADFTKTPEGKRMLEEMKAL